MCGRYAITMPPEAVRQWFQTRGEIPNWPVYYNAAPTTALPVVRQNHEGQRVLALMQWGLVPLQRFISRSVQDQALPRAGLWILRMDRAED